MNFSKKSIATILSSAMLLSLTSCSEKKAEETTPPPTTTTTETLPPETEPVETEAVVETSEETAAPTERTLGPNSTAAVTDRVVDLNGALSVVGTDLVNQDGEPIQLRGMSTYGMNGMYNFVNPAIVQTLAEDWGCSVIRLAMYTYSSGDAYVSDPDKYYSQMEEYIQYCIDQGVYVICDWHILFDGDPNEYKDQAIDFFDRISAEFGEYPNLIYEICNEPNGPCFDNPDQLVDWENCIRPYAVDVIDTIRANDPDNVIIVGTAHWSSDVELAALNPIEGDNLMYTIHFYAGSSGQEKRDKVDAALELGLPIFCTEWGTSQDSGSGGVYPESTYEWMEYFDEHNISWCNWSIGGSVVESSNALKYVSHALTMEEKMAGHWPDEFISESGLLVRDILLSYYTSDEG